MLYCLDARSGQDWGADLDGDGQVERAPFLWTGAKNGTPPPPMVSGFDNVLYRHNQYATSRGARSQVAGWKFGTPFISRITGDYGASDEPHIASGGGRYLYWSLCCDRESGWIDLSKPWSAERDRSREGPVFPPYRLHQACPGYDESSSGRNTPPIRQPRWPASVGRTGHPAITSSIRLRWTKPAGVSHPARGAARPSRGAPACRRSTCTGWRNMRASSAVRRRSTTRSKAKSRRCRRMPTGRTIHTRFAIFQAKAWILQQSCQELAKWLDVPAFRRGDCFYIHNLVSALEASR